MRTECQIMLLKAQADRARGIINLKLDKSLLPTGRQSRSFWRNAMGVVTKFLVKRGKFADCSLDLYGFIRIVLRIGIPLDRFSQTSWGIRM